MAVKALCVIFLSIVPLCFSASDCPPGFFGPKCDVEEKCAHPEGKDCSFYLECLNAKRRCDVTENVCFPKCQEYVVLEPSLSDMGQQWTRYVRKCLEERMSANVLMSNGNDFTCDQVQDSFFHDHLPCYTEGPISFCKLPLTDSVSVLWHAKDIFWKGYLHDATEAGVKLLEICGMQTFHFESESFLQAGHQNSDNIAAASPTSILESIQAVLNQYLEYFGMESAIVELEGKIIVAFRSIPGATFATHLDLDTVHNLISRALATVFGPSNVPKFALVGKSAAAKAPFDDMHTGLMVGAAVLCACVAAVMVATGLVARRRNRLFEESAVF